MGEWAIASVSVAFGVDGPTIFGARARALTRPTKTCTTTNGRLINGNQSNRRCDECLSLQWTV